MAALDLAQDGEVPEWVHLLPTAAGKAPSAEPARGARPTTSAAAVSPADRAPAVAAERAPAGAVVVVRAAAAAAAGVVAVAAGVAAAAVVAKGKTS